MIWLKLREGRPNKEPTSNNNTAMAVGFFLQIGVAENPLYKE
jgi:hypothetical protein